MFRIGSSRCRNRHWGTACISQHHSWARPVLADVLLPFELRTIAAIRLVQTGGGTTTPANAFRAQCQAIDANLVDGFSRFCVPVFAGSPVLLDLKHRFVFVRRYFLSYGPRIARWTFCFFPRLRFSSAERRTRSNFPGKTFS